VPGAKCHQISRAIAGEIAPQGAVILRLVAAFNLRS
jgi:hypothetical protein